MKRFGNKRKLSEVSSSSSAVKKRKSVSVLNDDALCDFLAEEESSSEDRIERELTPESANELDESSKVWMKAFVADMEEEGHESESATALDMLSEEEGEGDLGQWDVERMALQSELERQEMLAAADAEMKEAAMQQQAEFSSVFVFPSKTQMEKEATDVAPDLKVLKQRIEDVIEILGDFKHMRDGKHSRKDYLSLLEKSLSRYYGYSGDLTRQFMLIFGPAECVAFFEANEKSRPLTLRTNSLMMRRRDLAQQLIERGVNLDPLADWSKEGLMVINGESCPVPMGATPEYLSGQYLIQSAASMIPVICLDVNKFNSTELKGSSKSKRKKRGMKILDMSSAPGGKSTHIGQLMKNNGLLVLNDVNSERLKAVYANIHRMSITNSIIVNYDGRELSSHYPSYFDRVLLDAPCSCLGVISRDPSIKYTKTFEDVNRMSTLQKELIISGFDCLKIGGILVYSTCSVSPYENEGVIEHLLNRRKGCVKICDLSDSGIKFGSEGFVRYHHMRFHPSLKLTRRYYPHRHNLDGFYVAKVVKLREFESESSGISSAIGRVSAGGGKRRQRLSLANAQSVMDEIAIRKETKRKITLEKSIGAIGASDFDALFDERGLPKNSDEFDSSSD